MDIDYTPEVDSEPESGSGLEDAHDSGGAPDNDPPHHDDGPHPAHFVNKKQNRRRKKKKQAPGYTPPAEGAAHAFRIAEKKYKLYKGVQTDYSQVLDLGHLDSNTIENRRLASTLDRRSFRGKPIFTINGHPGFLVIPGAFGVEEQSKWIVHVVTDYMHHRTNIASAPAKGSRIELVNPDSPEGLARLQWATLGAHFEWTSRTYVPGQDARFPPELVELAREAYDCIGAPFSVENGLAGTVNYYQPHRQMCGHIDDAEGDLSLPLVSISLGLSCVYLLGGANYDTDPTAILLRSGDLVIMSGESRRSVHGVPRIIEDSMPSDLAARLQQLPDETLPPLLKEYACNVRLNVNVRTGVFA